MCIRDRRKERLKYDDTRLYDATGWSLALGYDMDAYFSESVPAVKSGSYQSTTVSGQLSGRKPKVGYIFSGADDRSLLALAKLLDAGVKVWCATEPFSVDGESYLRGSFLIRSNANGHIAERTLQLIAEETGVILKAVNFGLASMGSDLGGGEFKLLTRPKIALVGGENTSPYSFGNIWHTLDARMNMATSTLSSTSLAGTDLDKYNVLILPSSYGGPRTYKRLLSEGGVNHLREWVEDGGTLIAVGAAAAFVADSSVSLVTVRQKRQVLDKLEEYTSAFALYQQAASPTVDSLAVWEGKRSEKRKEESVKKFDIKTTKQADKLARQLSPQGVIMRIDLDEEHWLSFGLGSDVPIMVDNSYSYVSKDNSDVAGRFASYDNVKISGILWPEARERWANSVYCARESVGKGQVILFATDPNFREYWKDSNMLIITAVLKRCSYSLL